MTEDAAFYERALSRLDRIAIVLAAGVSLVFLGIEGWRAGVATAAMAAASIYNLRRLKGIAAAIDPGTKTRTISAVLVGLRYLLLGAICFVIIKYFEVSFLAIVAGLLVSVAAVLVEIVYELLFIR